MPERTPAEYLEIGAANDQSVVPELENARVLLRSPETWADPPPEVADGVLDGVRDLVEGRRRDGSNPWWIGIGGVAAAAFVVFALLALWPSGPEVVLAGTDLLPDASGVATLEATGGGWQIRLDVDLPPAEDGHYYEGWVWNDTGDGVSIGTFHLRNSDDPVTLWAGVDVADYPSIWVSLQEEGAGPALSDKVLLVGRLEASTD